MEISFHEDDHFVLEPFKENDDGMDENDNYKPIEQTKIEQPVDFAAAKLDVVDDPCRKISLESTQGNAFFKEQNLIARKRQTILSEYFFACPSTETSTVKPEQDDALDKMINVPVLISQLLNARVVLTRLPEKPVEHPEIETSTLSVSKHLSVQRYCYKCKTLNIDYKDLRKAKNCSKCEADLLYVCDSCNENHYHNYDHLTRHRSRCNGEKTGKSLEDVTLIYCSNCPYKTSYKMCIEKHLRSTGHQVLRGDKPKVKKVVRRKIMQNARKSQVDQLPYLVNKCNIDYSYARKRYCAKCAKIINSSSSNKDKSCKTCNSILLYHCCKCRKQYTKYNSIQAHIKAKCYPSLYRCTNCKYTATFWDHMKRHLKIHFPKLLRKVPRDVQSYEGKRFICEHCSFGTNYKQNLERHLKNYHFQLFI